MRRRAVTLPTLGLIAGTRATLGAGIGLLLASRLSPRARRTAGWTLLAIGALSTIPLAIKVFRSEEPAERRPRTPWPTHHAPEGPHVTTS